MKYQNEFSFHSQTLKHSSFRGTLSFDAHFHEDFEAIYVVAGQYDFTVDGQTQTLREGDFGLVLPNQIHSCRCEEKIHIWFTDFSSDLISTFTHDMRGKKGQTFRFCGKNTIAEALVHRYVSEFADYNEEQFLYSGRIDCMYEAQALLYSIVSEFVQQVEILPDDKPSDVLISHVAKYIQEHFREDISLTAMAADLGYDRFYLSRMFNQVFHMNFRQYINSCRIAHAKQLMTETKNSITNIAGECGYQSIRTFNHAFYALNGVSPTAFRSQNVKTAMWSINVSEPAFIPPNVLHNSRTRNLDDDKRLPSGNR